MKLHKARNEKKKKKKKKKKKNYLTISIRPGEVLPLNPGTSVEINFRFVAYSGTVSR